MIGVFNVKKSAIWHTIALTYGATTVINTDMLPWTAWIRYLHLAHQHTAGATPPTGMIDPPLDIIATPDILTTTRIDPGSVIPDPTHITTGIGAAAITTPIGVTPGHFTDLPNVVSYTTEAQVPTSIAVTHHTADHHPIGIFSQDDSGSRHKSQKHHYKPAQGSSSYSQATPWKHKDKRQKQVTTDDPPSEYCRSDDHDSDSEDDLN